MATFDDRFDGDTGFLARDLMVLAPGIPASMPCGEAMSLLLAQTGLSCLAVVGPGGEVLGMIERERLLSTFSNPLQSELYRRRPIQKFLRDDYLAVDETTHVDEIGSLIARDHPSALSAGFIVTAGGRYAGVCSGIRLLSMVETLTRRRAADLETARTRAEVASRAKSTFLAAMSHEIRTPLNSVVGNLELLEDASTREERGELIGAALSAAHTLLQILGDVLDFSKIESDSIQLESTSTSPAGIVRDVATQLFPKARERGIALTVHIGGGVPEQVFGDPLRLRQIVLNMAGNALKFTSEGRVALSLSRVWAQDGGAPSGKTVRLRFEVADTGAGFASERASGLFEAFAQEDASTTRRFGGAGLGLAISRRLVEAMGGEIGADGYPGGGATFWFEIPAAVATEAQGGSDPLTLDGVRVLVIGGGNAEAVLIAAGARVDIADAESLSREPGDGAAGPPYAAVVFQAGDAGDAAAVAAVARRFSAASRLVLSYPVGAPGLARLAYRHGFAQVMARPCPPAEIGRVVGLALGLVTLEAIQDQRGGSRTKPGALAGRGDGLPVLVIDDTAMNQAVVQRQLRRLGLSSEIAGDGARGLELATSRPYAAILVDCWMPVMDGYEFTRRFRAWEAETGRRTPVIATTAHALTEDIGTSLEAGMDYHLIKPVSLAHLTMVLDHWLSSGPGDASSPIAAPTAEAATGSPIKEIKPSSPPIDSARLADILGETDPDEVREVLQLYLTHAAGQLDRIAWTLEARDREALGAAAHAARGAARNAAVVALVPVLTGLEAGAPEAGWDDLAAALVAARLALDDVRAFIEGL